MEQSNIDYKKLSRIGGWLFLMILRLSSSAVMAAVSAFYAPSLGYTRFIPLFAAITVLGIATIVLLLCKKPGFRITYCIFTALSLLDYYLAQNAMGFVVCMAIETCWIVYLFMSVRVRLVLGLISPPDGKTSEKKEA